jgi:DNA invertase Pin-like site-specific DNA recombinase
LEAQRSRLASECAHRSWSDVEWITDAGASGKSLNRPGIQRALSMLASGQASTLLVTKLDRLSRSVPDFASLIERANREGWSLVALDLGVDTTTAAGKMVANVMMAIAEWERETISERTRVALAAASARGTKLGRPVRTTPEVREFIAQARQQGYTLSAIADTLTNKGVPTAQGGIKWYPSTISAILASA